MVSLDVRLSDIWGNVIEESAESVQYLHGGYGDIFPIVETALEGKREKDAVEVRLEPEDAYGGYDEGLLRVEPRQKFPEPLELGMRFEGTPGSEEQGRIFIVTDVADGKVVLDANHPLSGIALTFACTVVGVRPATETEIANCSADAFSSLILRILP